MTHRWSVNWLAAIGELLYSGGVTILENVALAQYTTLGVGGAARWFVETGDEEDILSAVRFARARGVGCFILGGGSNLLVSDEGFDGVVVRVAGGALQWAETGGGTASITAGAGAEWDAVVRLAVEKNGAGVECLAGIPGSVGGTPVQNVGAYRQEVSQTIIRVRALDLRRRRRSIWRLRSAASAIGAASSIQPSEGDTRLRAWSTGWRLGARRCWSTAM